MEFTQVIKRSLLTEKGSRLKAIQPLYLFEVHPEANKVEIRQAVESLFKVQVLKVATVHVHGKTRRAGKSITTKSDWKKAYVTLKTGQKIEELEV